MGICGLPTPLPLTCRIEPFTVVNKILITSDCVVDRHLEWWKQRLIWINRNICIGSDIIYKKRCLIEISYLHWNSKQHLDKHTPIVNVCTRNVYVRTQGTIYTMYTGILNNMYCKQDLLLNKLNKNVIQFIFRSAKITFSASCLH